MKPNFGFGNHFFLFYRKLLNPHRSDKEAEFLKNFIKSYNSRVLDLGCGWGRHLKALAKIGYKNLTGVDSSEKLLRKAKVILKEYPVVKLTKSDFAGFRSSKKYDFIFQAFQSFGYDTRLYDQENLNNVKKLLFNQGVYLLDLRSPLKLSKTEIFDLPSSVRIQSQIDQKKRILKYKYILNEIKDTVEVNLYNLEELKKMFEKAGLKIIKTFGDFNGSKYSSESDRLIIVAKKIN